MNDWKKNKNAIDSLTHRIESKGRKNGKKIERQEARKLAERAQKIHQENSKNG